MLGRAPITLWRHLLAEQWKLIALTTVIVVAVLSFAASVKPLADGKLAASEVPRFMLLAAPPMLAYALPFAAGFGATLAHHRIVQDNELVAAYAGGIGHRTLLVPAWITGMVLSGGLVVMNEQVIPSFLQSMERMIARDVARMLTRSVEMGEPLVIEDMAIYADHAWPLGPDPEAGAYERIQLTGLAVMGLEPGSPEQRGKTDGPAPVPTVTMELTASEARVWLFREHRTVPQDDPAGGSGDARSGTEVVVQFTEAYGSNTRDVPMVLGREGMLGPLFIPGAFSNDPKFLTFRERDTLMDHPARMSCVRSRLRDLARVLLEIEAVESAGTALSQTGRLSFGAPDGGRVVVSGGGLGWQGKRLAITPSVQDQPIEVERFVREPDGSLRSRSTLLARRAWVEAEPPAPGELARLTFSLALSDVRLATGDRETPEVAVDDRRLSSLVPLSTTRDENLMLESAQRVLAEADHRLASGSPSRWLQDERNRLVETLDKLGREVLSKRHERLAMSFSVLVMVLIGSIVAMRLRHSPPLIAYLWSFFPALASLLTISGGQQFVYKFGANGLWLLWGGLAGLSVLTAWVYRGLARH